MPKAWTPALHRDVLPHQPSGVPQVDSHLAPMHRIIFVDEGPTDCVPEVLTQHQLRSAPNLSPGSSHIAAALSAAKPIQWRGQGELLQLPFRLPHRGLWLVIDMWSGMSGLLFALLSLGLRFVAIAAESDLEARSVSSSCFPNLIHVNDVQQLTSSMFHDLCIRRELQGILLGGGSPCQGNSKLNKRRKSLGDPRSLMPIELERIRHELEHDPITHVLPIYSFLENVSSMIEQVQLTYSDLMKCQPLLLSASEWGWVERKRYYWGRAGATDVAEWLQTINNMKDL